MTAPAWYAKHLRFHPFLTFDVAWEQARPGLWDLVGRCNALFDLISTAPLKPALALELHTVSLAKYIQGTTAIEGREVDPVVLKNLVERGGEHVPEYTEVEIQNFLRLVAGIQDTSRSGTSLVLSKSYFCHLNRQVLDGAPVAEGINVGHYRHHMVGVHGYGPPGPAHVDPLMNDLCRWLNSIEESGLSDLGVSKTSQDVFKAVFAHLFFEMIHPFGDGNGRVGRLLELDLLARAGVPFPAALGLTSYYSERNSDYFAAMTRAENDPDSRGVFRFIEFAFEGLYQQTRAMADLIQQQTLDALWKEYVYEKTDAMKHRAVGRRQQVLALSLDTVPRSNRVIRRMNPDLAVLYSGKSDAILSRDLKILERMELAERRAEGWLAAKYRMKAYVIA